MSKRAESDAAPAISLLEATAVPDAPRPRRTTTLAKLILALGLTGVLVATVLFPYVGGLSLAAGGAANQLLDRRCTLRESSPPQRSTIYASDGTTVLATLFSQDREPVALSKVPVILRQALIATEDRRFYSHHGVDLRGLARSAIRTSSGDVQGGSTLTMQYVKEERFYQARNDAERQSAVEQTVHRKIEDARCALWLENTRHESKAQILDKYLNIAFFGNNSYGVQTAAQRYFGVKDVSQLRPWQSAMLVGLVKSPTQYDPYGDHGRNAHATMLRRNEVIQNLVDVGAVSSAQAKAWQSKPLDLATSTRPAEAQGCSGTTTNTSVKNAGFFCDYLTAWLEDPRFGRLSDRELREGGLKIVSTLDAGKQNDAQAALAHIAAKSPTTAMMPELDPRTGAILAMASSKQYGAVGDGGHSVIAMFTQTAVNASSTFELFPLLAALSAGDGEDLQLGAGVDEKGNLYYSPSSCSSAVSRFYNKGGSDFTPVETLASAVAKASSTYFVALEDRKGCDLRTSVSIALALGLSSLKDRVVIHGKRRSVATWIVDQRAAEFALGPYRTNPLELSAAYAAVANDGVFNAPTPVRSVTRPDGRPVTIARQTGMRVIDSWVAQQAMALLSGQTQAARSGVAAEPFAAWYRANPSPIAGASGTNSMSIPNGSVRSVTSSMWFVGATPRLVAATLLTNLAHPSAPLAGLPGLSNARAAAQGAAYAARYWLAAVRPSLDGRRWQWFDTTQPRMLPPPAQQVRG